MNIYSACGKSLGAVPTTTLGYERLHNHALRLAIADEEAFIKDILSGQPEPPPYFATMKRVNRDGIAVTGGTPQPPHLTGTALAALNLKDLRILDTRRDRDAFCSGHVTGALHAPLGGPYFSICAGSYLYPEDKILLLLFSVLMIYIAARMLHGADSPQSLSRFACKNALTAERKPTPGCAAKLISAGILRLLMVMMPVPGLRRVMTVAVFLHPTVSV